MVGNLELHGFFPSSGNGEGIGQRCADRRRADGRYYLCKKSTGHRYDHRTGWHVHFKESTRQPAGHIGLLLHQLPAHRAGDQRRCGGAHLICFRECGFRFGRGDSDRLQPRTHRGGCTRNRTTGDERGERDERQSDRALTGYYGSQRHSAYVRCDRGAQQQRRGTVRHPAWYG